MNCKECSYITLDDMKCAITGEARHMEDVCDCENRRLLKDSKSKMTCARTAATDILSVLRSEHDRPEQKPNIDIAYIYETLQSIAVDVGSDRLNELIQYVALYV